MRADNPSWPRIVLVSQGDVAKTESLLKGLWPDAPFIADESQALWKALEVTRAPIGELFGPRVWLAGLRSFLRGHFVGKPVGDPFLRPAVFLIEGGRVGWSFQPDHAGDLPGAPELAAALT